MTSANYIMWKARLDFKTCFDCRSKHGKIYTKDQYSAEIPPLHTLCRCITERVTALFAGTATHKGNDGADWWLKYTGGLPEYYITVEEAERIGYKSYLGNLSQVAPGKMLFKGRYSNRNGHLPSATGRVWYEADINYAGGFRGKERILFSNDGLVFATYDHYLTFQEII